MRLRLSFDYPRRVLTDWRISLGLILIARIDTVESVSTVAAYSGYGAVLEVNGLGHDCISRAHYRGRVINVGRAAPHCKQTPCERTPE
jgi:hypothetical protein